jgi:Tfp pilus assembly protein FimV
MQQHAGPLAQLQQHAWGQSVVHANSSPVMCVCADDLCGSREISPPRQRKPPAAAAAVAGTERKFSWATQRITELTHEQEKAQKHIKVQRLQCL